MLKILFCTGQKKDNNLLLKIEIDSELNQSFRVQRKNGFLKQSALQLQIGSYLFPVLKVCSR